MLLLNLILFTFWGHCASVGVCTCYNMYVEARAQSCAAWLFPLLCESPRDRRQVEGQPWWKVTLPTEPSHWSLSFYVSLHCPYKFNYAHVYWQLWLCSVGASTCYTRVRENPSSNVMNSDKSKGCTVECLSFQRSYREMGGRNRDSPGFWGHLAWNMQNLSPKDGRWRSVPKAVLGLAHT